MNRGAIFRQLRRWRVLIAPVAVAAVNGARVLTATLLLFLLAGSAAHAQMAAYAEPGDPVPGANGLTYLDLVREIVPDIAKGDDGRFTGAGTIDLPHADTGYDMAPPAAPNLDRGIGAVALGGTRHLLLVDLGEPEFDAAGYVVLALFDTSGSPRLGAALNVGFDRWTHFLKPAVRSLGAAQLITTASEHFSSNQTYTTTALVLLRDGRFEPIDNISTFGEAGCLFERPQGLAIATTPSGTAFADIVATVTEHVMPSGFDCGEEKPPEASSRTITVTYEWDEAQSKYVPDSDAFDRLAAENSERF